MNNIYRWIVASLGLLITGFLVWYFHTIVFYILIAAVISIMGQPLVKFIERLRYKNYTLPKWVAALITLVTIGAVVFGLLYLLLPIVISKLEVINTYNARDISQILAEPLRRLEIRLDEIFPEANISIISILEQQLSPIFNSAALKNTLGSLTTFFVDLFVAIFSVSFISFFFLKDENLFNSGVVLLFPKKYEGNILRAISSITMLLTRYFIGICIESLIKLICVSLSLYLMGFELSTAMLIGLITAVLNVIPYIGPLMGAAIAFMIAFINPVAGASYALMSFQIAMVLGIFQLLDNVVLQPYIYSSSVKAHPLEIFIVILMAGYIAGITGMLFAIPAYTVLRVFAKEFFNNFRVVQRLTEKI